MDWMTTAFIVGICLVPIISLFFVGEKEYTFSRNIFKARGLQIQMLAAVAVISIGFLFVEYESYIRDMITFAILFFSLATLTFINFIMVGEGTYRRGMLLKGSFLPWEGIKSYKFDKTTKPGYVVLFLTLQNKKTSRVRKYVLEEEYQYQLEKQLKKHISNKISSNTKDTKNKDTKSKDTKGNGTNSKGTNSKGNNKTNK